LVYPPSSYCDVEELVSLGRVVEEHDGILLAHIRNEQDRHLEALEEMVAVAAKAAAGSTSPT